jgi:hypothetical protein
LAALVKAQSLTRDILRNGLENGFALLRQLHDQIGWEIKNKQTNQTNKQTKQTKQTNSKQTYLSFTRHVDLLDTLTQISRNFRQFRFHVLRREADGVEANDLLAMINHTIHLTTAAGKNG